LRLAKYLAHSGAASRRAAEQIIATSRVTVAGETVTDPARDVSESDDVRLDGQPLTPESHEVWLVNKPPGVVSTAKLPDRRGSRPKGGEGAKPLRGRGRRGYSPGTRPAVVELVDTDARLYPVGRLDVDSAGLLLLTNDGELANRLTHPRYEVPKTYRATLARPPAERDLESLRRGIELEDGPTAPAQVRRTAEHEIEITIHEGRNRQVRRMVEAIGNEVASLERIRLGSLELGDLAKGGSRRLSDAEVERLWKDARS
jgi:23S rRNA pseudouridine2605 synthase